MFYIMNSTENGSKFKRSETTHYTYLTLEYPRENRNWIKVHKVKDLYNPLHLPNIPQYTKSNRRLLSSKFKRSRTFINDTYPTLPAMAVIMKHSSRIGGDDPALPRPAADQWRRLLFVCTMAVEFDFLGRL